MSKIRALLAAAIQSPAVRSMLVTLLTLAESAIESRAPSPEVRQLERDAFDVVRKFLAPRA